MSTVFDILARLGPLSLIAVLTLAVFGGLCYIVYLLIQQSQRAAREYEVLTTNHLHELPAIAETLRRIETQQGVMAAALLNHLNDIRTGIAELKGRLNK